MSHLFPLSVVAQGMCCSVGFDSLSAAAAIRARLNHFHETQFRGADGKRLVGGQLHEVNQWGTARLIFMLRSVLSECWSQGRERLGTRSPAPERTALLVITAEPDRPAVPFEQVREAIGNIIVSGGFHSESRVAQLGKAGFARALIEAARLLSLTPERGESPVEAVMIAAVDSLLDAPVIERYIAQGRLAAEGVTDALIPGEGAASMLLMRQGAIESSHLVIRSATHARDAWTYGGEQPMRAQALTEVIRAAAADAGNQVSELEFHVSGMSGEEWYSREMNMALSRTMESRRPVFPHHMLAQFLGETATAAPALSLAWLASAMPQGHRGLGERGLLHFASEDGQRSAMVVALSR